MGDGIAAFFGLPHAHEDDPERAARAALAIVDVVTDYAREVEAAWGISDFNLRVGINTGETTVGLVGHADPQSVALGDTTNVAARLQSSAEPGSIAVGQATAQSLLHAFVLEPLGELSVKGRDKPVEAWRLVCPQTAAQAAPLTPLVGRDEEVGHLQAVVDELTNGRGQMLFLLGDAGIGKTRLLAELRQLATERVTWLEGRCLSYGTELPYGPLVQMLRGWVGSEEGEPELSVRTKLRAKLGLLPESELPNVLPYLSRLLSLKLDPEDEERMRNLAPEELAGEIRRAYRTWMESLARQGPVVVALEDVHFADPSTRELAEDLLELADRSPLLIVATFRLDTASEGWRLRMRVLTDYAHRAAEISLDAAQRRGGAAAARDPRAERLAQGGGARADRAGRRGEPALPRGAAERVPRQHRLPARAHVGADGHAGADPDARPREPAARPDRPPAARGAQARADGGAHRPQLPAARARARRREPGRRGRPRDPPARRHHPRAAAVPRPGVHVQARTAAPRVPLDAAARPPPRAVRRGRRGPRDALRRLARRQPRGARALLLTQPRPAEGARVPRARRRQGVGVRRRRAGRRAARRAR